MNKKQKLAKRKQKKSRLRLKAKQAALLKNKKVALPKVSSLQCGLRVPECLIPPSCDVAAPLPRARSSNTIRVVVKTVRA